MKVAIQGEKGSFHHAATQQFTKEYTLSCKETFDEVFNAVNSSEADLGCVAIENALYGSLHENYDRLKEFGVKIVGEVFLKISHNLLANKGVQIQDVKQVWSHPVALKQCKQLLNSLDVEVIEHADTAGAAKEIKETSKTDVACIASKIAAELYDLDILKEDVQDHKENYTRFLFLSKNIKDKGNKISLNFQLSHESGSLLKILQIISDFEGNMTKLESRPILGKVWQYQFYVDVVVDKKYELIGELKKNTSDLNVLGIYQEGKFVD